MRVSEEPVFIYLFRQNPVFTSLHLRFPVHVVPPQDSRRAGIHLLVERLGFHERTGYISCKDDLKAYALCIFILFDHHVNTQVIRVQMFNDDISLVIFFLWILTKIIIIIKLHEKCMFWCSWGIPRAPARALYSQRGLERKDSHGVMTDKFCHPALAPCTLQLTETRLYWCLIEFADWRYSQSSCWYFRSLLYLFLYRFYSTRNGFV